MTTNSLKVGLSLENKPKSRKNLIVLIIKGKIYIYIYVYLIQFGHILCGFPQDLVVGHIIFPHHDHTALLHMFVLVCLFCDIQSHGTSIAVWGETSITGFVLHASKAHCPEMSVPSLICVSTHMPPWQYRTAPAANGVDARWLKTNPSHRKKKNGEGGKRGRGRGETGGGEKNNGAAVLHSFKRLFITMVPLSGSLPVYPWGESNPCQTHLWAWMWRNGPSWSHADKLQAIGDTWTWCVRCYQILVQLVDIL